MASGSPIHVRRIQSWLGVLVLLLVLCIVLVVVAGLVPQRASVVLPHEPISLERHVRVNGRIIGPLQGSIEYVGVEQHDIHNLRERLTIELLERDADIGEPVATGHGLEQASDAMADAKDVAAGVAWDLLAADEGGPRTDWRGAGATVRAIQPGVPAARVLQRGDVITAVDGRVVGTTGEVSAIVRTRPPGSAVTLGVQRGGIPMRAVVRTVAMSSSERGARSMLGVELDTIALQVVLPAGARATIDSGDVVGPSAGLAFALYLYDARARLDLLRGRHVVATGSLTQDGRVGPVGYIRQKAIAAVRAEREILLVPTANAVEARTAVADACPSGGCTTVVPVGTARDAIRMLSLSSAQLAAQVGN